MRPHPGALSKYHSKPGFEVNRSRFLLFEMKELYSLFCLLNIIIPFFFSISISFSKLGFAYFWAV